MISKDTIDAVLARADIVEEVGRRIALKKGGINLIGLCPFHGEKTPSFSVSPTKQFYHCFGCGTHGNVIDFLMKHDGMDFPEAIEDLGTKLGVAIKHENNATNTQTTQASHSRQDALIDVLCAANDFYRYCYGQNPAVQDYAQHKRQLTAEVMDTYGIGYAPAISDGLRDVFSNYDTNQLVIDAGLTIELNDGPRMGERYDRFRDRLMFPIRDTKGRIIGFGGRVIDASKTPKYLNSPETEIFAKHRVLYGLHEGRASIMKAKRAFVVEGYMDVVAMAMHGIGNAVAAMGTALTQDHARILMRFTQDICFLFDGDKAGRAAAWKSAQTVLPLLQPGCNFSFLTLPDDQDPDEFLGKHGPQRFHELAKKDALSLSEFIFKQLTNKHGKDGVLNTLESKANFAKDAQTLCDLIAQENPLRALMLNETVRLTGVGEQTPPPAAATQFGQPGSGPLERLRRHTPQKKPWLPPEEFKAKMLSKRQSDTGAPTTGWQPWNQATEMAPTLPNHGLWGSIKQAILLAPQAAYEVSPHVIGLLDAGVPEELDLIRSFDALENRTDLESPANTEVDERQAAADLLGSAVKLIHKFRKKTRSDQLSVLRNEGKISEGDYLVESLKLI